MAWLSVAPLHVGATDEARTLTPHERRFAAAEGFGAAYDVVLGNCSMCHAREPVWEGLHWPPKGVVLETEADVARHAEAVFLQAGASHAMPPPNAISTMDAESRAAIVAWYRNARAGG